MPIPAFELAAERESSRGWEYDLKIAGRQLKLTLSWSDHDHWSGGSRPPSAVAQALIEQILEVKAAEDLPEKFDASTCRRWVEDLDSKMIGRVG